MSEPDVFSDDEASPEQSIGEAQPGPEVNLEENARPALVGNIQDSKLRRPSKSQFQARKAVGATKSILPAEKVFPIQVGTELFRLSGASISSDGPSYFTHFFEEQVRQNEDTGGVRTLYIDRDPVTFRDIARHLQGYFIKPVSGEHFVRLFADAQFYSLPRFIEQLFESDIFIQIGEQHFQIPKDLFAAPGNSPNFFSLGFAVFFSTSNDVFPGLDKRGLLRPPPISPPCVPGRSSEIFVQLLHMLRGYPIHIENEVHRAELLRDCRYFHLRALEQRIIAHEITFNLLRQKSEICVRLEDIKPSGISYRPDEDSSLANPGGWIHYQRPFVDEIEHELVFEIGNESTAIDLNTMRIDFHGAAKRRVASLLTVVANKMNLPLDTGLGLIMLSGGAPSPARSPGFNSLSDDSIKITLNQATYILLDGRKYDDDFSREQPETADDSRLLHPPASTSKSTRKNNSTSTRTRNTPVVDDATVNRGQPALKKRRLNEDPQNATSWTIRKGQWRMRVQPTADPNRTGFEVVLVGVKIDAISNERARNERRGFLV